jgi:signal transduction histidine kinase
MDRCRVAVTYAADALDLEITDAGGPGLVGGREQAAGHGLAGMRERAGTYGGKLSAAPLPGGGFRVATRFPLTGAAA